MPRDAPPSSADVTTSLTCRDSVEVKAFTSSGITAPASVPQEMIEASFHHCVVSSPSLGRMTAEIAYVSAIEMNEVSQTREVSGASKFMLSALLLGGGGVAAVLREATARAPRMAVRHN